MREDHSPVTDKEMQDAIHEWLDFDSYDLLHAIIQDSIRQHDRDMLLQDMNTSTRLSYADVAARVEMLRHKIFGPYVNEVG